MAQHLDTGAGGEQLACRYLEGRGFRILERNWRSGPNELDIICTDGKFLVVVEVKTRRSAHWGEPELAVNKAKRTGIMLVDTKDRTVHALSPERKLYMDVPNMRLPKDVKTEVKKTGEMRDMAGYKCEKWIVKSPTEDRSITYWVAADEFNFFVPLLETLNRKDEQAVFFLEIDGATGVFPMLGVEQKLDGSEVSKLEVSRIVKGVQKPTLFEIPGDYNKFERN